jgi:chromate transporter
MSGHARGIEEFTVALRLGLTSFGGPIAHVGYFERTYVRERGWLNAPDFAALLALCQLLPGPTSSQLGLLIGHRHGGWRGALGAFLGFTLPSALIMGCAGLLAAHGQGPDIVAALHGLALVTVAVVVQALFNLAPRLCPDAPRRLIALLAALLLLTLGHVVAQALALLLGALLGTLLCRSAGRDSAGAAPLAPRNLAGLALFVVAFLALTFLARTTPHGYAAFANVFFRAGSLVFGGGHVVLPLLNDTLVRPGWISGESFVSGYGLAQALPGPLFSVAGYFGAANAMGLAPLPAAGVALLALFGPGLLLALSGGTIMHRAARFATVQCALAGANAAVVGILAVALYNPVITSAIAGPGDVPVALIASALLVSGRVPSLVVVALCVLAGLALHSV